MSGVDVNVDSRISRKGGFLGGKLGRHGPAQRLAVVHDAFGVDVVATPQIRERILGVLVESGLRGSARAAPVPPVIEDKETDAQPVVQPLDVFHPSRVGEVAAVAMKPEDGRVSTAGNEPPV